MSRITLGIRAVNVPENMPHEARSREVLRLPDFLRVNMDTADGLALVNYGSQTPPLGQVDLPWVKLNPDGSPAGIFVYHDGAWVRALPNQLTSTVSDMSIQGGEATVTHEAAAHVTKNHEIIVFSPVFKSPPTVILTPTGGTLCTDATNLYYPNWVVWAETTIDRLTVHTRVSVNSVGTPQTLKFQWHVLGVEDV